MKLLDKMIDKLLDENKPLRTGAPCPYCAFIAWTLREEVEHMEHAHPDIIAERLRAAGLHERESE